MIKRIFFAIVFTLVSINFYSQIGGSGTSASGSGSGSGGGCISTLFTTLANCLSDNGISYSMLSAGDVLYLYAQGTPPPGQITSCLAQYDSNRSECEDAPVIVNQTGTTNGIKRARVN